MALALCFARSVAAVTSALRFAVLPLIDSVLHLAFEDGVEGALSHPTGSVDDLDIERSARNVQLFTLTKYFEAELQRSSNKSKPTVDLKSPDS